LATRVVVIGSGPGGYQAALRAAQLGARVSLVEAKEAGGTCLNWGCIPTKALLASAAALDMARNLGALGVNLEGTVSPDWQAMLARKSNVVQLQVQGLEKLFASYEIELVRGQGRLAGPNQVEVALNDGGKAKLDYDRLILATGSRPADLPGLARDGQHILNSDDMFALGEIPASLAVVGGGVVGCEFANIMSALGSQVFMIEALDRLLPLPSLDPDCSRLLQREFKKRKIKASLGMVVNQWRAGGQGVELELGPSPLIEHGKRQPKPQAITVDKVLVAVGRALNTGGLELGKAGVERDERGAVIVDNHMRTTAENIYAVGDMLGTGRPMLAHMAGAEGVAAAANAMGGRETVPYDVVPSAAFTSPEVAWVGLSPVQAAERGLETNTAVFNFRALGKSQAMGELAGQCKLVCAQQTSRLLGAHIIGPHAADLIHECALALQLGATTGDLARTIHAHPTLSEAVHETAEACLGLGLHSPPARPADRR
jgi:dihydrolipoamide dehydrogenase